MKNVIFMEGFKSWPASTTFPTTLNTTFKPAFDRFLGRSDITVYSTGTGTGKIVDNYDVEGTKYAGPLFGSSNYADGWMQFTLTPVENKRHYIGARIASKSFRNTTYAVVTSGTTDLVKPSSLIGGSFYYEIVVDTVKGTLDVYCNKSNVASKKMSDLNIKIGAPTIFKVGSNSSSGPAPTSTGLVVTDVYLAEEDITADNWVEPTIYGPVAVDSHQVTTVQADEFRTDAATKEEAVAVPYTGVFTYVTKPLLTSNTGDVGRFTFRTVTEKQGILAAQYNVISRRGTSSNAQLVGRLDDSAQITDLGTVTPVTTAEDKVTVMSKVINTTANGEPLTSDYLNKTAVLLNSKEL